MPNNQSPPRLNRRRFLQGLTAAGTITVGGYLLAETTPWLDYAAATEQIRQPLTKEGTMPTAMRELVRYATLAANGHNAQPWRFAITADGIDIHPDYSRRLPVVDPQDRELWISLGCALENLLVAARAAGYAAEVSYPDRVELIHVDLRPDTAQPSPFFDAIPHRQNTRTEYDGQPVKSADLNQLGALALEPGVSLRFVDKPNEMATVIDYVNQGNLNQYADAAFVKELTAWLRFNKREAMTMLDGLYSASSGNPQAPRWLGRFFLARTNPQQQADSDARKLRSSPGAVVIAANTDDKAAWVRTGQVYERLALQLTALDLKSALLNQPLEVATLRSQFQNALGLGSALPQLLVRFGSSAATLPRSLRRPVEDVLIMG